MKGFSEKGRRLRPPAITELMKSALETPGLLSLAAGFTDTASLPVAAVARIVGELAGGEGPAEFLQYGSNPGRPRLRELLARRLAEADGIEPEALDPDAVVVTHGSQQGLALASEVLVDPGDLVLVERPTYFVYLDVLRSLGAEVRSLPTDPATGQLDQQGLATFLARVRSDGAAERLKTVYLVSYFSNPASRSMGREDKEALAATLREAGLAPAILEDAAYRDLYFADPASVPSVLSLRAFDPFPRLYLGTLTKPFATGLKVGYAYSSDPEWLERILYLKGAHDFGTANFNQTVVEAAVEGGELDTHLKALRPRYWGKMEALHRALLAHGLAAQGWSWEKPSGGLYLWLRAPGGLETGMGSPFWNAAMDEGVLYVPGELCFGDEPETSFVRLSFGVLDEDELGEAAERFVRAARRAASPRAGAPGP